MLQSEKIILLISQKPACLQVLRNCLYILMGGEGGARVDVMCCVMLKSISHDPNGYYRKTD